MKNNDILENGLSQTIESQNQQIEDLKFDLMVNRIINVCSGLMIAFMTILLFHYMEKNKILEDNVTNLEKSNISLRNNLLIVK